MPLTPRPPDPDELVRLSERAVKLQALADHPAWPELRARVEERRDKHMRSLLRRLTAGGALDQREIDRQAGFWKGALFVLDNPELAEKDLQNAIAMVKAEAGEERTA
ncbi:MAG: hypothetical protein HY323_05440 [Betaproteobacteria bacterium]|nr:hypothetical protein [Betaproteobacteria bacterium]